MNCTTDLHTPKKYANKYTQKKYLTHNVLFINDYEYFWFQLILDEIVIFIHSPRRFSHNNASKFFCQTAKDNYTGIVGNLIERSIRIYRDSSCIMVVKRRIIMLKMEINDMKLSLFKSSSWLVVYLRNCEILVTLFSQTLNRNLSFSSMKLMFC